jgi:Ca2+-binding EF-hand superfamily protein
VTKILSFAAAAMLPLSAVAVAQNVPKPVARADYIKNIDARFNIADTNHDGSISKVELAAEQQRELQMAKAQIEQKLQQQFKQLDTNKDGQLSLREFMAAAPGIHSTDSPDEVLQRLDANHDGKISVEEYRAPEVAKFNRLDANHDGIVTPAELRAASGQR